MGKSVSRRKEGVFAREGHMWEEISDQERVTKTKEISVQHKEVTGPGVHAPSESESEVVFTTKGV